MKTYWREFLTDSPVLMPRLDVYDQHNENLVKEARSKRATAWWR